MSVELRILAGESRDMRQYRSWAIFLGGILLIAVPVLAQFPQGQSHAGVTPRSLAGWIATPKTEPRAASPRATDVAAPESKKAYFQAPNSQWQDEQLPQASTGFGGAGLPANMPAMPTASLSGQGIAPADSAVQQAGGTPPALDQFSNPGGQLPATDVRQASGSGFRDAMGSQPTYPPQVYSQPAYAGQVYPPQSQAPQSSLRSTPQPGSRGPTYNPVAQQTSAHQQQQRAHNGVPYTVPIVTQDPRFVSPPPAPRGNYATSPYQPLRLAAYQVNQAVPAQTAQVAPTRPSQPAVVVNTSSMPQFQPVVGVHPTAYQIGYPQCDPSFPSNGVPAVVPGAVVPPTLPPNLTPQLYTPDNAGYKPLFSLGQENYNVLLGRGVIGQPTVYVPGQPMRNFLRYLSP